MQSWTIRANVWTIQSNDGFRMPNIKFTLRIHLLMKGVCTFRGRWQLMALFASVSTVDSGVATNYMAALVFIPGSRLESAIRHLSKG